MRRTRFFEVALLSAMALALLDPPGARGQTWTRTHGGDGFEQPSSVRQTDDQSYIAVGRTSSYGAQANDLWVLGLHPSGALRWERRLGGGAAEFGNDVIATADGRFLLAGSTASFGNGPYDAWLVKLDAGGNLLWQKTYGGTDYDSFEALEPTPDGGVLAVGYTESFSLSMPYAWAAKLDAEGDVEWSRVYGGGGGEVFHGGRRTPDGGYILAGNTSSFSVDVYNDVWVVKIDATGEVEWQKAFGRTLDPPNEEGHAVAVMPDGSCMVGGWTAAGAYTPSPSDYLVLKLDAHGDVLWQRRFAGNSGGFQSGDELFELRATSGGGAVLAGNAVYGFPEQRDAWVLEIDADGNVVWQHLYGDISADDYAFTVEEVRYGGFLVAGQTRSVGGAAGDAWFFRLDASGAITSDCALVRPAGGESVDAGLTAVDTSASAAVFASPVVGTSAPISETVSASTERCIGPPTEVSPAGSANPLVFLDGETLSWEEAAASNAQTFNVYRGNIKDLSSGQYGSCLKRRLTTNTYADTQMPRLDEAWQYLVTGANDAGEGTSGFDSSGTERVEDRPCP